MKIPNNRTMPPVRGGKGPLDAQKSPAHLVRHVAGALKSPSNIRKMFLRDELRYRHTQTAASIVPAAGQISRGVACSIREFANHISKKSRRQRWEVKERSEDPIDEIRVSGCQRERNTQIVRAGLPKLRTE